MKPGIVFSDVDGTLLDSRQRMQPGTLYSIRTLREMGVPFVIVSARSPSGIRSIFREFGFTSPMIAYSGALILDENGTLVHEEGYSTETAGRIIRFLEESFPRCVWNLFSQDTWLVKDRRDPWVREEEAIVRAEAAEGDAGSLPPGAKAAKILCMCDPSETAEIERALKEAFPELSYAMSSDRHVEVMPAGVTKSSAVRILCRLWKIPMESTVAFGDHYNDAEMLETAAMPFLMGNAPEELKGRFANVTRSNDEEGIYTALTGAGIIPPCSPAR